MLFAPIAAGPAFDGHDFAIQPFSHGVGHPVAAIGQNVVEVSLQHGGDLANRLQAGMNGPGQISVPIIKPTWIALRQLLLYWQSLEPAKSCGGVYPVNSAGGGSLSATRDKGELLNRPQPTRAGVRKGAAIMARLALAGMVLGLVGCAILPEGSGLPRLPDQKVSQGLIPQEYLCPGGDPKESVDLRQVAEVKAFLEENSMLDGLPFKLASDLPLILNGPVKTYLRYFANPSNAVFQEHLARSTRYLPMIRRIFRDHGLPQDLAYLALVESGFSPWARSPAEAVGLWQFILGTARRYDLKVDAWVDERRDPEKSTRAAARYLKDLYHEFGCWYLAAAGYNAGGKRVEGVVNRYDTRDFWTMAREKMLPEETCNYVPHLIAVALIAKNAGKYGFTEITYQAPLRYERVKIPGGTDLRWFSEVLDIPYKILQDLNPELNRDRAPKDREEYLLKVPATKKAVAIRWAQVCWKLEK